MVNSQLMIMVSRCWRLLPNNACLCLFIKALWYTWKLYRGNWSENVQNVMQTQTCIWLSCVRTNRKHTLRPDWELLFELDKL